MLQDLPGLPGEQQRLTQPLRVTEQPLHLGGRGEHRRPEDDRQQGHDQMHPVPHQIV